MSSKNRPGKDAGDDGQPATLMIAARSELLGAGLLSLLPQVPQVVHIASANDGPGVVKALVHHQPDVLLLDHELVTDVHGYAGAKGIDLMDGGPRVLLLSARHHIGTESACGERRACGFVREQSPLWHIRSALHMIGACGASRLGQGYCGSCPLRNSVKLPMLGLSDREYQIFQRIGHGRGTQQIARELGVSVKTIETHRESIKRKLDLDSAAALAEAAVGWRRGDYVQKAAPLARESAARRQVP
ncbi:response regulator transcription factor [Lysobacter terrae]